jgi:hypothetical protein
MKLVGRRGECAVLARLVETVCAGQSRALVLCDEAGVDKAAGCTPVMSDSGVRDATDAIIALAMGKTAVGIGRPHVYALSYGETESLTHYLNVVGRIRSDVVDLWIQGHCGSQGHQL